MTVRCPAKLNLHLSVGPADASGMHPVVTTMVAVSLYDVLTVAPAEADSVVFDPPLDCGEDTVTRALRLAREHANVPPVAVCVTKAIPSESGLGGGSSNAAGLLRALAASGAGLDEEASWDVARRVGVDTPFFLVGGFARCTGYGEVVEPLPDLPCRHVVVVRPSVGVASGGAYARLDALPRALRPAPPDPWELSNDFLDVAPGESLALVRWLLAGGAEAASLTGSGSACFGVFADGDAAAACARSALPGTQAWALTTLGREASLWTS